MPPTISPKRRKSGVPAKPLPVAVVGARQPPPVGPGVGVSPVATGVAADTCVEVGGTPVGAGPKGAGVNVGTGAGVAATGVAATGVAATGVSVG